MPQVEDDAELEDWRSRRLLPTQRRVLSMFKAWLSDHAMIEEEPEIARRLQDFLSEITAPPENVALASEVTKTLERMVREVFPTCKSREYERFRRPSPSPRRLSLPESPTSARKQKTPRVSSVRQIPAI